MTLSSQIRLETDRVMLRPLVYEDLEAFRPLVADKELWTWFTFFLHEPGELERWVNIAWEERNRGIRIPFTIIKKDSGEVCGSTSYGNITPFDKRIEIGWSWLAKQHQGTGINFHAKFLLLEYAFDVLQWERVEIKTDDLNERAKQGLRKIGARQEGILRSHMQMPAGRRRDSVYFSILKAEWTGIRQSIFRDLHSLKSTNASH